MALVCLCVVAALLAACAPAKGSMLVGSEAPEFRAIAVIDKDFKEIALSQYRGNKYVVIFFYPLDFTFGASTCLSARKRTRSLVREVLQLSY